MAGNVAGDATVFPATQNALNAFHTPGSLRREPHNAFLQIINNEKPKVPLNWIYFNKKPSSELEVMQQYYPQLVEISINDVVEDWDIYTWSTDLVKNEADEEVFANFKEWVLDTGLFPEANEIMKNKAVLVLDLDRRLMAAHRLTMSKICEALETDTYPPAVRCFYSPFIYAQIFVFVQEQHYTITTEQIIAEAKIKGATLPSILQTDIRYQETIFFNNVFIPALGRIKLGGIPKIKNLRPRKFLLTSAILDDLIEPTREAISPGMGPSRIVRINIPALRFNGISLFEFIQTISPFYARPIEIYDEKYKAVTSSESLTETMQNGFLRLPGIAPPIDTGGKSFPIINSCEQHLKNYVQMLRKGGDEKEPLTSEEQVKHDKAKLLEMSLEKIGAEIEGDNIAGLLSHSAIDPRTVFPNSDIRTAFQIFGIDGTRTIISYVLKEYCKGFSLNARHVTLIASFITRIGYITPINYQGLAAQTEDTSTLLSFERITETLSSCAARGIEETTRKDVTLAVFAGVPAPIGKRYAEALSREEAEKLKKELGMIPSEIPPERLDLKSGAPQIFKGSDVYKEPTGRLVIPEIGDPILRVPSPISDLSSVITMPPLPELPPGALPGLPELPPGALPGLPELPPGALPGLPGLPLGTLPGLPGLTGVPELPLGALLGLLGALPKLPGLSS
jgi:hypothetical protein